MNTSQIMDQWQASFGKPSGGQLGIIVAIIDIGAVSSFWMVYVETQTREWTVDLGSSC